MSPIANFLTQILLQSPVFLALLAGVILSIMYARRHPRPGTLAAVGFGVLLLRGILGGLMSAWLPVMIAHSYGMSRVGFLNGIVTLLLGLVAALGYGLIIAAVLAERDSRHILH